MKRIVYDYGDEEDTLYAMNLNPGPVVVADPCDTSKMCIANKIYANTRTQNAQIAYDKTQSNVIKDLLKTLREGIGINFIEDDITQEYMNKVISIVTEYQSGSSWMRMGSGILTSLGGILSAIPGLNVMWGIGCYAGGSLLNWIDQGTDLIMKENMMAARYNYFDNLQSNVEKMKKDLQKDFQDIDEKIEKLSVHMNEIEERVYKNECSILNSKAKFHGIQIWGIGKKEDDPVMLVLFLGLDSPRVFLKVLSPTNIHTMGDERSLHREITDFEIEKILDHRYFGNSKNKNRHIRFISYTPIFTNEDIILERFQNLNNILLGTRLKGEDFRTFILLYLHVGIRGR